LNIQSKLLYNIDLSYVNGYSILNNKWIKKEIIVDDIYYSLIERRRKIE
jgi:hypothetical protein